MKPETWGLQDRQQILQGPALQAALAELCERKQSLLLATPYLQFESRFIEVVGNSLRVRATMGRQVVRHTLEKNALRLRFPWNLTFFGGPTTVQDYEDGPAGKFLRLSLPQTLGPDDLRKACRVVPGVRCYGVLGSQAMDLVRFTLEDISPFGLGAFCIEPIPATGFQEGRILDVSLTLEHGPVIEAKMRVCHGSGQNRGLSFQPPLEGLALVSLIAWLEPRLAEAQRRWDDRASFWARAERAAQPKAPPGGILLVSSDPELQQAVTQALAGTQELRTVAPALAPLRDALDLRPPYVLLLASAGGYEESHRLRAMLDNLPRRCPMVILGTGADTAATRILATELKATLFLERNTLQSAFFQRLMLGLIRKHWNLMDGGGAT